jgi:hypothetical protein
MQPVAYGPFPYSPIVRQPRLTSGGEIARHYRAQLAKS